VDDEFDVLVETAIREHASPREAPLGSPADTPRTAMALHGSGSTHGAAVRNAPSWHMSWTNFTFF
jgi:hypothetical protein